MARAASQSTIHPIDTIKVRMQTDTMTSVASTAAAGVSKWGTLAPPPPITGPVSLGAAAASTRKT